MVKYEVDLLLHLCLSGVEEREWIVKALAPRMKVFVQQGVIENNTKNIFEEKTEEMNSTIDTSLDILNSSIEDTVYLSFTENNKNLLKDAASVQKKVGTSPGPNEATVEENNRCTEESDASNTPVASLDDFELVLSDEEEEPSSVDEHIQNEKTKTNHSSESPISSYLKFLSKGKELDLHILTEEPEGQGQSTKDAEQTELTKRKVTSAHDRRRTRSCSVNLEKVAVEREGRGKVRTRTRSREDQKVDKVKVGKKEDINKVGVVGKEKFGTKKRRGSVELVVAARRKVAKKL